MNSTLELFINDSIYTVDVTDGIVDVPLDLVNVSVSGDLVISRITTGALSIGDSVTVNDTIVGTLMISSDDSVVIMTDNKTLVKVYRPNKIESKSIIKQYSARGSGTIIGNIPTIRWFPSYTLRVTQDDSDMLLQLNGTILNNSLSLTVDNIIFNTKSILDNNSYSANAQVQAVYSRSLTENNRVDYNNSLDERSTSYSIDDNDIVLSAEVVLPLNNYMIDKNIHYYATVGNSNIVYGYEFTFDNYIPQGQIRIIEDGTIVGISSMKRFGNLGRIEVSNVDNMTVTSTVTNSDKTTNISVTFTSEYDEVIKLQYPTYGRIISHVNINSYTIVDNTMIWKLKVKANTDTHYDIQITYL